MRDTRFGAQVEGGSALTHFGGTASVGAHDGGAAHERSGVEASRSRIEQTGSEGLDSPNIPADDVLGDAAELVGHGPEAADEVGLEDA